MKKIVQVNVRKMGQRKICYSLKNVSQLEKFVTVRKMCHTRKMCCSKKNGSHLGTRVTVRKMCHSWKNLSQLEKCVTRGKCVAVRHT